MTSVKLFLLVALGFCLATSRAQTANKAPAASKQSAASKAPAKAAAPAAQGLNACDKLAGHPGDPNHKGDGVFDEELAPAEAIPKCAAAVQQQPKNARFLFQLGRAYWVGHQYDKAVRYFLDAEELKYAPAYHYLGLAYEQGKVKGEKPDAEFAKELYQMAASEGFDAAAGGDDGPAPVIEKAEDLDASVFKQPVVVRALFAGEFDNLNSRRSSLLPYLRGMHEFVTLDPNEYDPSCLKLADHSLNAPLNPEVAAIANDPRAALGTAMNELRRMMSAPQAYVANAQRNEQLFQDGIDDMNVLSEDYGSCAGPVVQRVYAAMKRFVREKPAAASTVAAAPSTNPRQPQQPNANQPQQPAPTGALNGSRVRPAQFSDLRGLRDRAMIAPLQQELNDLSSRGFLVTECSYGRGAFSMWKNNLPALSDSLRIAMPGIMPIALAHCPKELNVAIAIGAALRPANPPLQFVAASPALAEVQSAPMPNSLPPMEQAYKQAAESMQSYLLSCRFSSDPAPVLYWRNSLPARNGEADWGFIQFVSQYWRVMPVAVDACPLSATLSVAASTFKDY